MKRRAVDLGGFRLRLVDVGKCRQQDQEHEGRPLPDLAEDDGGIDQRRIDRPQRVDALARKPADDLVDRAVLVVEQQPPGRTRHDGRDDGGQHQKRNEDLPARHALEKEIGHGEAEHQLERQRDRGDQQRMRQRPPQPRVLEQVLVVVEAREGGVRVHHVDAHEGDDRANRSAGTGRSAAAGRWRAPPASI